MCFGYRSHTPMHPRSLQLCACVHSLPPICPNFLNTVAEIAQVVLLGNTLTVLPNEPNCLISPTQEGTQRHNTSLNATPPLYHRTVWNHPMLARVPVRIIAMYARARLLLLFLIRHQTRKGFSSWPHILTPRLPSQWFLSLFICAS